MESIIVNRQNASQLGWLKEAYETLYTDILNCWEGQAVPTLSQLKSAKYTAAVLCKEGTEIVGALLLRGDEVYYPVIKPGFDHAKVLRSMIEAAYNYTGHLHAWTRNEFILRTAMNMGIAQVTRDGYNLEWN